MIEYKGYTGIFEYDSEIDSFVGRVPGIKGAITFYGKSTTELKREMVKSVDEYLAFCAERGIEPAKPYSGRFNVRMEPEVHRAVAEAAAEAGESMNDYVVRLLESATAKPAVTREERGVYERAKKSRSS